MRIKIEMELPRWLSRLILVGIPIAIVAIGAWVYAGVKTFNPGDKIRIDFHPLRSGEAGGFFTRAVIIDSGKEISIPNDPKSYFKPGLD